MPGVRIELVNSLDRDIRVRSSIGLDVTVAAGVTTEINFPTDRVDTVRVEITPAVNVP